jgi:hypothetical protein
VKGQFIISLQYIVFSQFWQAKPAFVLMDSLAGLKMTIQQIEVGATNLVDWLENIYDYMLRRREN